MTKDSEEVSPYGKPAFYAFMYTKLREVALECGYALAVHGTLASDLDLVAVAWKDDCVSERQLVRALDATLERTTWLGDNLDSRKVMEAGRVCYTLSVASDWFIDLTVCNKVETTQTEALIAAMRVEHCEVMYTYPHDPEGSCALKVEEVCTRKNCNYWRADELPGGKPDGCPFFADVEEEVGGDDD